MNRIAQYFYNMSSREKSIIILGLISSIGIVVYGSVGAPLIDRYSNLERIISQKESQYREVLQLRGEYFNLQKEYSELENAASKKLEGFSPLTFMEGVSLKAKIKDKVVSMKPTIAPAGVDFRESTVEVKIEKVVLEQIMLYLHYIESSEYPLRVKTLHLKSRFDDPGLMDASVAVSFYEKVK